MRTVKTAVSAALLLAAVTACSSSHPAPAAGSSSQAAAIGVETSASATGSASPSASGLGVALGTAQTASASGVTVKLTASSYKVITLTADNQELVAAGTKIALVQATGCLVTLSTGQAGVTFTWKPWTLVTSSGATVQPLSASGTSDFPGSLYPNDSQSATPVGRCRSGLIPFSLAGITGTPTMVEYNVDGVVLDWNIA